LKAALLADHADLIPTLAEWYLQEWEPYYGTDGPGDARADLEARCNRDSLPIGLVAIDGDRVGGVVALDEDKATKLTPSVVGLLVAREHRGGGIAGRLLEAAADLAAEMGYSCVYVSTGILGDFLLRTSWRLHGEARFLNGEKGSVYVLDLQD